MLSLMCSRTIALDFNHTVSCVRSLIRMGYGYLVKLFCVGFSFAFSILTCMSFLFLSFSLSIDALIIFYSIYYKNYKLLVTPHFVYITFHRTNIDVVDINYGKHI